MAKAKKERFVVEFPLLTDKRQEDILNKRMEHPPRIYNQLLSKYDKRYKEIKKNEKISCTSN